MFSNWLTLDSPTRNPQSVKNHRPHLHFSFHSGGLRSSPVVSKFKWCAESVAGENTLSPATKVMYNFFFAAYFSPGDKNGCYPPTTLAKEKQEHLSIHKSTLKMMINIAVPSHNCCHLFLPWLQRLASSQWLFYFRISKKSYIFSVHLPVYQDKLSELNRVQWRRREQPVGSLSVTGTTP